MQIWKLRAGADRRFRAGHPWVYSNELAVSPKGLVPGSPVEIQDSSDRFLARGYGNPASLIAFRAMSRDAAVVDPMAPEVLLKTLEEARRVRSAAGMTNYSYRLCFGEADRIPGLVIDCYRLSKGGQVFALQAHSAGADRMLGCLPEVLEKLSGADAWKETSIVVRNDLGVRKLEGLESEPPRVLRQAPQTNLNDAEVLIAPVLPDGARGESAPSFMPEVPLKLRTDLVEGQKTGLFLDQFSNIQLAALRLRSLRPANGKTLRVLDLCCYVGQWSAQFARVFRAAGIDVEVTAFDASAKALAFAKANIEAEGARCKTVQGDVLKDLEALESGQEGGLAAERFYDIVISDPPALIKNRKDIPAGTHAYLQLNTQVFRLVRPGGGVVTCSCSGLLEETDFLKALSKAAYRNHAQMRWIGRGTQSPDHPMLLEFEEGRYLKCWVGIKV